VQTVTRKQFLGNIEDLLHRFGALFSLAGATWRRRWGHGMGLGGHGFFLPPPNSPRQAKPWSDKIFTRV